MNLFIVVFKLNYINTYRTTGSRELFDFSCAAAFILSYDEGVNGTDVVFFTL